MHEMCIQFLRWGLHGSDSDTASLLWEQVLNLNQFFALVQPLNQLLTRKTGFQSGTASLLFKNQEQYVSDLVLSRSARSMKITNQCMI